MRKLVIACFVLASHFSFSANPITVFGYGTDRESAKKDGFRTAIENFCGLKILSKRENRNNINLYDEVVVHSTCRVISYKILQENTTPYYLKMEVQVQDTKGLSTFVSESNEQLKFQVDLNDVITQYYDEKKSTDNLIDAAFREYPYNAFKISTYKKPYITDDQSRNLYLVIPIKINWNYEFIQQMQDIFHTIENRKGNATITVMAKSPNDFILGKKTKFYINDFDSFNHIKTKFVGENELRIRVRANDSKGNKVLNLCYSPEYKMGGIFYSVGISDELTIFGNDSSLDNIKVKLNIPAEVIYDLSVDVAAERDCRFYMHPL